MTRKKKYAHYEIVILNDSDLSLFSSETLHNEEAAVAVYNHFKRKKNILVSLYGRNGWKEYKKLRTNHITKTLYIFYGTKAALEILEKEKIDKKVKNGTSYNDAFNIAKAIIDKTFPKTSDEPGYELNLDCIEFKNKSEENLCAEIEHFKFNRDKIRYNDAYGNPQGYISFLVQE